MDISLPGYKRIKDEARDFWMRVATDLRGGLTVAQIAKRYTNPKTGTHYSREHIYWIIRQLKTISVEPVKHRPIIDNRPGSGIERKQI